MKIKLTATIVLSVIMVMISFSAIAAVPLNGASNNNGAIPEGNRNGVTTSSVQTRNDLMGLSAEVSTNVQTNASAPSPQNAQASQSGLAAAAPAGNPTSTPPANQTPPTVNLPRPVTPPVPTEPVNITIPPGFPRVRPVDNNIPRMDCPRLPPTLPPAFVPPQPAMPPPGFNPGTYYPTPDTNITSTWNLQMDPTNVRVTGPTYTITWYFAYDQPGHVHIIEYTVTTQVNGRTVVVTSIRFQIVDGTWNTVEAVIPRNPPPTNHY